MRSMATNSGMAVSSASTHTSDGPAIMSMPTSPFTSFFAAATNALPGPVTLLTAGMVSVPYAMAAMACAPPTLKMRSTPAALAATSV